MTNKLDRLLFISVENRTTGHVVYCNQSIDKADVRCVQLTSTDAGEKFEEFKRLYKHYSPNSKEFEVICFRRYFILEQYLLRNQEVEEFVLIDSDVLIFRGIEEHMRNLTINEELFSGSIIKINGYNPRQISPHFSYWSRKGLMNFVKYVVQTYSTEQGCSDLELHWNSMKNAGVYGGISDMTLLYNWADEIGAINAINRVLDKKVLDHNITIGDNVRQDEYNTLFGFKRIFFLDCNDSDNHGIFFRNNNGEYIQCLGVHCQGRSKLLMRNILNGNKSNLIIKMLGIKVARSLKMFISR